jgi:hypothetical protein
MYRLVENTLRDDRQRLRLRVRLGTTSTFSSDVGRGGLSVELMKALPVGATVTGSVQVQGEEVPFVGRVAWVRPGDRHLNLPARMGVRFTRIATDLSRLAALEATGKARQDTGRGRDAASQVRKTRGT